MGGGGGLVSGLTGKHPLMLLMVWGHVGFCFALQLNSCKAMLLDQIKCGCGHELQVFTHDASNAFCRLGL